MKRKISLLGIIAIAAVLGFSMVACSSGNRNDNGNNNNTNNDNNDNGNKGEIPMVGDVIEGKGTLVWSDEFNGTSLDLSKWNIETGNGSQYGIPGWGNSELQSYQAANVSVANGMLTLQANRNGNNYTSARITTGQVRTSLGGAWTSEKFHIATGRVEARIKISKGLGMWPAFWLLGANSYGSVRGHAQQTWPRSGEIDILEFDGGQEQKLVQTIHYGPGWPINTYSSVPNKYLPGNAYFSDDFHIYGAKWDANGVEFTLNGVSTGSISFDSLGDFGGDTSWRDGFSNEAGFSIILNLAVGGNMGGSNDPGDINPVIDAGTGNKIQVDWVRVYQ